MIALVFLRYFKLWAFTQNYLQAPKTRNEAVVLAYKSGDYTLQEIGHFFDLHYSLISRIVGGAK